LNSLEATRRWWRKEERRICNTRRWWKI